MQVIKEKTRDTEFELRRQIADAWHSYLTRLHRGGDADAVCCRHLDEMAAALDRLRNATADRLGVI